MFQLWPGIVPIIYVLHIDQIITTEWAQVANILLFSAALSTMQTNAGKFLHKTAEPGESHWTLKWKKCQVLF